MSLTLGAAAWTFEVRPRMPSGLEPLYHRADDAETAEDGAHAAVLFRQAAEQADDRGLALFLFSRAAAAATGAKAWEAAEAAFGEARKLTHQLGEVGWEALIVLEQVDAWRLLGETEKAEASLAELAETLEPRADLQLLRARVLERRGELRARHGRLSEAEVDMREVLEVRRREAPDGLWVGRALSHLALIPLDQGRLDEAERLIRQSLEIEERENPGSISAGASYSNLALIAQRHGDLMKAEELLARYSGILDERGGPALRRASVANNQAVLRAWLGDLDSAVDLLERAIELKTSAAVEDTVEVALSLTTLAEVQRLQGSLERSRMTAERSLAILEKVAPGGLRMAAVFGCLGNIARNQGDLDAATRYFERVLEILRRESPGGAYMSRAYSNQAAVWMDLGEFEKAEAVARRAVELNERRAALTEESAAAHRILGKVLLGQGHLEAASAENSRALDDLDALARLGGRSDLRQMLFWRKASSYYAEALEIEARLGRPAEAYFILERSRARSLVRLLANRGLDEPPPALAAEMSRMGHEYETRQAKMATLSASTQAAEIERLAGELRALRRDRELLWERAAASGRLSALAPPLDAAHAGEVLDPGTRLLAYSVGRSHTVLLTLARGEEPRAVILPVGAERLLHLVSAFRSDIEAGRRQSGAGGISLRRAERRAEHLYDLLIGPVEQQVEESERLLLMPDGALHDLPFASLLAPSEGERRIYLVERRPLHVALSMTMISVLRKGRSGDTEPPRQQIASGQKNRPRLVAFGDPRYPAGGSAAGESAAGESGAGGPAARSPALRHSAAFRPLPGSKREVSTITALFPGSRAFLGEEATEEAVRNLEDVDILHLACHGVADSRSPLDSAVALTPTAGNAGGGENGLLQAWEILQDLHLDAQLVVLSACSSAAGEHMGGEGLVGLARAFQGAGARSVLAPLWNIRDDVTPELMEQFYRELREGKPEDEALRSAQLSILRQAEGEARRPPYLWAAFQLYGDRR